MDDGSVTRARGLRVIGVVWGLAIGAALSGCGGGAESGTGEGDTAGEGATTGGEQAGTEDGGEATAPCGGESAGPCGDVPLDAPPDAEGGTTGTSGGETSTTPPPDGAATGATTTPPPGGEDPQALARAGSRVFERRCDSCHPGGDEDIGPRIIGIRWAQDRMRRQIRQGSGRMRPIPAARLSDADMERLFAHLVTIRALRPAP